MKMKYVLFDIIGQKSGCKYYDVAFYKQLLSYGYESEIHSNFSIDEKNPKILNIFKGNKLQKLFRFSVLIPTFIRDLLKNRNNGFIYMTYGEVVDAILILLLLLFHPKPILDVHEFISLDKDGNNFYSKLFSKLYKKIYAVIYHSERSEKYLKAIDYQGKSLFVPHFKYEFDKSYDINKMDRNVINAINSEKINILFFGHMRKSKGVELVFDSIKETDNTTLSKFHFIFAGDDSQSIVKHHISNIYNKVSCSTILRFIKDEELNFLFDKVNLVLLPYEEVSQSGILETAVYFRKTMILTDIAYFKSFYNHYSSFSYIVEKGNSKMLANLYKEIGENGYKDYSQSDLEEFYETDKFNSFFLQLKSL